MRLAADVGGTKTALALVDERGAVVRETTVRSRDFSSLESLIAEFLEGSAQPARACIAVAGPVRSGRAQLTNLDWDADASRFEFETKLIHDVAAIALAVRSLKTESLQAGESDPSGTFAVVAPGTGLGFAFARGECVFASEAGHATFAPTDDRERAWAALLERKFGRASRERACSGASFPMLEEFAGDDAGPMFAAMLGAIAGDWALSVSATGGLYLAGGMAGRVLPSERFLEAFADKGRFRSFVERVPVHLVRDERAALRGAIAALQC